jgi:hypothetical protein
MLRRRPAALLRGLAAGVALLAVAGILTLVMAFLLQYRAREVAQSSASHATASDARRDTVPPASGPSPDGRSTGAATGPVSLPSPGPNPTPAPER